MSLLFDEIMQQPNVLDGIKRKNKEKFVQIADEFRNFGLDSIYFVARGTSDHACIYAQYLFAICGGIPCTLGTPSAVSKYGTEIKFFFWWYKQHTVSTWHEELKLLTHTPRW